MKRTVATIVAVSIVGGSISGCAEMGTTGQGAAIGAVAGGLLGAAVGKRKGAAVGALLGAAAGAIIANYMDRQNATRDEAARKYSYDAATDKLEIEGASISPPRVPRGAAVESAVQYTALAPADAQQIKISEVRTLVSDKETVDLGKREVMRAQGTHTSTMKFTVPKDIPRGNYTLVTTVSDGRNSRSARSPFTVA